MYRAVLTGLLLVLATGASGTQAASTSPILSAHVTIAGPSVVSRLAERGFLTAGRAPESADQLPAAPASWSVADLTAVEARVRARQELVVAAARELGVQVVSRYTTAANGLLVHATAAQLAALAKVPGVVAIEPAPLARPALSRTVPYIGADRLASELGYDGQGTVVAVVDSGIDYTHAAFGGPGTPEAYEAAASAAEVITDTWQGELLFPTEKVVGGWDFVGPNYTSPAACSPPRQAAGKCTSTPHPDPDPLDQMGHGTSVAGVIASQGTGRVYHGVAPEARLVALKIYGPPARGVPVDEAVDVVLDAVEWCTRVNLGLPVPGTAPERIDVINLSLGESYAQGSRLFDQALAAAVDAGIVIVASAGNDGNLPFMLNAPAANPTVLAVAGTLPPESGPAADTIWSGSARGPGKNGALGPDLAAPASGIETVALGTGVGASAVSGTSVASPHVAGSAALLAQRNMSEMLGLGALDLAALLMNHARPAVHEPDGADAPLVGVSRQGAGRVDVWSAGRSRLLIRTGAIASLNLGPLALERAEHYQRELRLRNLSDRPLRLAIRAEFAHADDEGRGVLVRVPTGASLPGRGLVELPVSFEVDPAGLRPWALREAGSMDANQLDTYEIDGWIVLTPVDDQGQPTDEPAAQVPFYLLPRSASRVRLAAFSPPEGATDGSLRLANDGPSAGDAELFVLPQVTGRAEYSQPEEDPDEPLVLGELDIRRVGVRFTGSRDEAQLGFGIGRWEVAPVPYVTGLEVFLDTDLDGHADHRLRTGTERSLTGQGAVQGVVVAGGRWDDETGTASGEAIVGRVAVDLNTRVMWFSVPLSAVGLSAPAPLAFYVVHHGLTEDWLHAPATDVVPDGAGQPGGPWFTFDPAAMAYRPVRWSVEAVGPDGAQVVLQPGPGDWQYSFMALYPDNSFAWREAQLAVLAPGSGPAPPPGPGPVYLPLVLRAHRLYKVPPPSVMVREALDELAGVERLRMTYDWTDAVHPANSANRDYLFDGREGMWMIASYRTGPRSGERDEFIRWLNQGYKKPWRGDWQCWTIDRHMLLWPEMVARLRREFPASGWEFATPSRGRYQGREVWRLHRVAPDGRAEYLMYVDAERRWPLLLSRGEPNFDAYRQRHIYVPRDFNDPTISTGPPRGVRCP